MISTPPDFILAQGIEYRPQQPLPTTAPAPRSAANHPSLRLLMHGALSQAVKVEELQHMRRYNRVAPI